MVEALTANSDLHNEITDLKDCNWGLPQHIEALRNRNGKWATNQDKPLVAMSDVLSDVRTVAVEMQTMRENELNF